MPMIHEFLMHAVYFAPRGKHRIFLLGSNIAQRYLSPEDKLIGLIGDAGAGKSLLIRGMFPGLELTNDDNGINLRPLPLIQDAEGNHFRAFSYHLDVRFESAFTPLWEIAEAVQKAVNRGHRVILEHFDLLYPVLKINAQVLIGIGEEVLVTRPGVFGPEPNEITKIVFESIKYRKMAHSAEDLTAMVLESKGIKKPQAHSDIKHGFILEFDEPPNIDLDLVEAEVLDYIARNDAICYHDEEHIIIGEEEYSCTGPRIHVRRTGEINNFRLLKGFRWDPITKLHVMAGLVGEEIPDYLSQFCLTHSPLNKLT